MGVHAAHSRQQRYLGLLNGENPCFLVFLVF